MSTSRILTQGGFVKIPLEIPDQNNQKARLYYLPDHASAKIEKAKAALLQEIKKRVYQGELDSFEQEIKRKPYLIKHGNTFELTEGVSLGSDEIPIHQIKISQKVGYLFEKAVNVVRDFKVGDGASIVINVHQAPAQARSSVETVMEERGNLKHLQDALRSHYISCFSDEDEKLSIQNYARLAIIGESERKEKRQDLGEKEASEGKPAHEAPFESKRPIELETLFEHDSLKNAKEKRVLILGGAGTGKSTLCQYIAYQWAVGKLWTQFKAVFWVKLRHLNKDFYSGNSYTAFDLLTVGNFKLDFSLLSDKNFREQTLLILDGYDELSSETEISEKFNELKKLFPHILITSRPRKVSFGEVKEKCTLKIVSH